MVSPLINTPIAMMASKGPEDVVEEPDALMSSAVRSVVLDPRRSPAPREEEVVDWIWEAEKSLRCEGSALLAGHGRGRKSGKGLLGAGYR
jgi:hypothetical protein